MRTGQVRTDEAATSSLLAPFARDVLLATGRAVHVRPAGRPTSSACGVLRRSSTSTRRTCASSACGGPSPTTSWSGPRCTTSAATSRSSPSPTASSSASARTTPGPDDEEAEVAFTVADAHHHEGIATVLLEDLALIARAAGFRRLVAETLPENAAMLGVFRTVGLVHRLLVRGRRRPRRSST